MSINKNEKKPGVDGDQRLGSSSATDNGIQRLHRLEKAIGIKLEKRGFEEILEPFNTGYALTSHEHVVGLNLDQIELGPAVALIPGFLHLQRLSLHNCQLTDISFLQGMNQLTHLYLYNNQIADISFLKEMSHLTNLSLASNPIKDYSILKRTSELTQLYLSNNQITDISFLQGMGQLTQLDLGGNQITDIFFLQGLSQLTQLYLYNNQITNISFLQGLSQLTQLDLSNNQIIDISFLQRLSQLTQLFLSSNQITDISFLQGLSRLTQLFLGGNRITDISCLQELSQLRVLNLRDNQIADISCLQGLNHLNTLQLWSNKITQLPEFFLQWGLEIDIVAKHEWGQKIYLYDNPLEKPPLEIIKQGNAAIKAYFDSLKAEILPLNEVKVLLVGDGGAGKTSLAKQLLGHPFDKHEPQTHGINIDDRTFQIGDQEIITHLWDFGGQEIMHATHQFFLSKRSLYILVLDGRKEEKTEYWLKHIESFGKDSPVLVVLNKIDENPGFEVNRKFLQEKYPNIKGFFRISCETREGIETFSRALEDQLSRLDMLKTTWAAAWFNVKTYLEKMHEPFISYTQYLDICRSEKIAEKTGQETLVEFLHDLGTVLYFKDLELEDTHVLQPGWVTTAVYKIINSPLLASCGGVLKLDLLEKILAPTGKDDYHYPPDKYRYIIQLMKKFELCYDLDRDQVLTPDLLPVEEPTFDFPYVDALQLIIRYDFLPRSILPRFMVRQHKDIKEGLQWRTGVVLGGEIFQSTAVVKVDEGKHTIYIYVHGGQEKYYLAVLRYTFKDINRGFDKLGENERVPLPDDPEVTVSYDHLLRLRDMKQTHYIPEGAAKEYLIADLLHDYEENNHSSRASLIDKRWQVLKDLDQRISDPHTLEKDLHKLLEKNLWILGTEYDPLSSDESLKTQVEEYLGKEYRGERARKRPDLVLARDSGQRFLLLELKRPGHILNRQDGAQAQTYADELNRYLPQVKIEVVVLGGKVDSTLTARNQGQEVKYLSYRQVVSNARKSLEWLLGDMQKD